MASKPSINWQLLGYVILTLGETMVSITGLEFSYTQAPNSMKSSVMALMATFHRDWRIVGRKIQRLGFERRRHQEADRLPILRVLYHRDVCGLGTVRRARVFLQRPHLSPVAIDPRRNRDRTDHRRRRTELVFAAGRDDGRSLH